MLSQCFHPQARTEPETTVLLIYRTAPEKEPFIGKRESCHFLSANHSDGLCRLPMPWTMRMLQGQKHTRVEIDAYVDASQGSTD